MCFACLFYRPYQKHYLWSYEDEYYIQVHSTPFKPISEINILYENENFKNITVDTIDYITFSIKKDEEYTKECLENFFIPNSEMCPITDIILKNEQTDEYKNYNEKIISNDKYLYYTRDNKKGGLYEYTKEIFNLNFTSTFNYKSVDKIKRKEELILSNPFVKLKNYIKGADIACIILVYFCISVVSYIPRENLSFNIFKYLYILFQIACFICYLIRYLKFVKIKNVCSNNKDIFYEEINEGKKTIDEYYFPNQYFNFDSYLLALSLIMIVALILYTIIPLKFHCYDDYPYEKKIILLETIDEKHIILPFILLGFLYTLIYIFNIINDIHIFRNYNNLMYNWEANPISSIELSSEEEYELAKIRTKEKEYNYYNWKNNYFKIKKLNKYNYINIFKNEKGKICGKDSNNSILYFPENVECPINDIIITDSTDENKTGYTKLDLGNDTSLFYTNKKINGKIIIDLKASIEPNKIELNLKKSNEICAYSLGQYIKCKSYYSFGDISFHKIIDDWNFNSFLNSTFEDYHKKFNIEKIYLSVINYLGVNSNSIKRKQFNNFNLNMKAYNVLFFFKIIFYFYYLFFLYYIISKIINKIDMNLIFYIILSIFALNIIILVICLNIQLKYINNLIYEINENFDEYGDKLVEYIDIDIFLIVFYIATFLFYIISAYYFFYFNDNNIVIQLRENNDSNNNNSNNKNSNNNNINNSNNNNININNNDNNNININDINKNNDNNKINSNNKSDNINNNNIEIINANRINHENIANIENSHNSNNYFNVNNHNKKININLANSLNSENKLQSSEQLRLKENKECIFCCTNPTKVIFIPCGHRCSCEECYNKLESKIKECPICRKTINYCLKKIYDI